MPDVTSHYHNDSVQEGRISTSTTGMQIVILQRQLNAFLQMSQVYCLTPPGMRMHLVFLGDPVQLKPVMGEPIYIGRTASCEKAACRDHGWRQAMYHLSAKGQELYRSTCVTLCRGQRSCGLLQICDRPRKGEQNDKVWTILMRQSIHFPVFTSDATLHYDNDSCSATNWRHFDHEPYCARNHAGQLFTDGSKGAAAKNVYKSAKSQ